MLAVQPRRLPLSVRSPSSILGLLLDKPPQIHAFIELIGFCAGIANPAFGVELLRDLRRLSKIETNEG